MYYRFKFEHEDVEYDSEVELDIHKDLYGSDADGNRGIVEESVQIGCFDVYLNGELVTDLNLKKIARNDFEKFHMDDCLNKDNWR